MCVAENNERAHTVVVELIPNPWEYVGVFFSPFVAWIDFERSNYRRGTDFPVCVSITLCMQSIPRHTRIRRMEKLRSPEMP